MEPPTVATSAPRTLSSAAMHRRHQKKIRKAIERQQQSANTIIPYTSFSRLVHEIVGDVGDYCVRSEAIKALQEATEDRMTDIFKDANKLATYNGRETVNSNDLKFVTPDDEWAACHMDTSIEDSTSLPLSAPAQ